MGVSALSFNKHVMIASSMPGTIPEARVPLMSENSPCSHTAHIRVGEDNEWRSKWTTRKTGDYAIKSYIDN